MTSSRGDVVEPHAIARSQRAAVGVELAVGDEEKSVTLRRKLYGERRAFGARDAAGRLLRDADRRLDAGLAADDVEPTIAAIVADRTPSDRTTAAFPALPARPTSARGGADRARSSLYSLWRTPVPALMNCTPPGPTTP